MEGKIYRFDNHVIHYCQYGKGKKVLLAFHGFGQNGAAMAPIANSLENEYTTYSMDIFYHGKSHWGNPSEKLSKDYWCKFLMHFLEDLSIDRFSMVAFSMGGKFALSIIEKMNDRIDHVYFIAPDGIQTQMWYNLATYPIVFQNYFKSMIVKPQRFQRIVNTTKRLGLIEKGILKFAYSQMNSVKKRRRVYYSWVIFKDLTFDLPKIAKIINDNGIVVDMFLGVYDKIITEEGMNKLLSRLTHHNLHLLECGHNNLIDHTAAFLSQNK